MMHSSDLINGGKMSKYNKDLDSSIQLLRIFRWLFLRLAAFILVVRGISFLGDGRTTISLRFISTKRMRSIKKRLQGAVHEGKTEGCISWQPIFV